ncbi:hypothetical protein J5H79_22890, partial [Providencia rettgeri]|nr:hypothetical protein [Providencia rettgeri]
IKLEVFMGINDILNKIDSKKEENAEAEIQNKQMQSDNESFLRELVINLAPMVKEYEEKLSEKGIKVKADIGLQSISFELKFNDGGHWNLLLAPTLDSTGRFSFTSSCTNDDGRPYTSTNGSTYGKTNWQDEMFFEKLDKHIEDFIYYSDRHGGF